MEKKILAIGGAVIKTAREQLFDVLDDVEILIHSGASMFHDFQMSLEPDILKDRHSLPLDEMIKHPAEALSVGEKIYAWMQTGWTPNDSITRACKCRKIPVYMLTIPGADFWHLALNKRQWGEMAALQHTYIAFLAKRFEKAFWYVCMGSAVLHPETFIKALAWGSTPVEGRDFRADVVDFLDMYRPRTRVACYGNYYQESHVDYLKGWKAVIEFSRGQGEID